MRRFLLPLLLLASAHPAWAGESLGVFDGWAAFRDKAGGRCYAIAEPSRLTRGRSRQAFASIGLWPARGLRPQFYARLSRARGRDSRVYLSIADRRFALQPGKGREALTAVRTQDGAMDSAIIAAMRDATTMSIESMDSKGRPFFDLYTLSGAPTAVDAAALACRSF